MILIQIAFYQSDTCDNPAMRFAILEDSRSQALLIKAMVEELGHEGEIFPTAHSFREGRRRQNRSICCC